MYKKSKYNITVPYFDIHILYNTATAAMLELDNEHYESFSTNDWTKFSPEEITLLREQGFVKFNEEDEVFFQTLLRKASVGSKIDGISSITISPTTNCNARCSYCYENDMRRESMRDETVNQLITFLINNISPSKNLHIGWHGGEPLLEYKKITKICKALNLENIETQSAMNTNGYLFTDEIIKNAVEDWHLKTVQITIDELNEEYDKIKNYIGVNDAFKRVLDNMELLLNNNISVTARINYQYNKIGAVMNIIDFLHTKFGNCEGFDINVYPLFSEELDSFNLGEHPHFQLLKKLYSYGYRDKEDMLKPILRQPCSALTYNSFCVSPNGKLYLCQHAEAYKPEDSLGDVFTDPVINQIYRSWCTERLSYAECNDCILLPCCQGGCKSAHYYEERNPCLLVKPFYKELIQFIYELNQPGKS